MSKPSVLEVACRLTPSIKRATQFDLDDIEWTSAFSTFAKRVFASSYSWFEFDHQT
jgi:hypothetical protein